MLPGFVEAHAHLGVHEEAEGWAGQDPNEMTDPNGARMRVLDAINPADEGFRDALSGGVTTAVVKPGSGNPIGGQTVALKCWGRMVDEMLLREPVSVKSALGENPKRVYGDQKKLPSTRQGVAAVIRDAMMRAQDTGPGATGRRSRGASLAVKEGLDRAEALRALTLNPARIMGLDDRVGSLAVGKDADVVVRSGDPLDVFSRALRVFVGGREVYTWDDAASVGVVADP